MAVSIATQTPRLFTSTPRAQLQRTASVPVQASPDWLERTPSQWAAATTPSWCDKAHHSDITRLCQQLNDRHDRFKLTNVAMAGATIGQMLCMGITLAGLTLGALPMAGIGAGAMVLVIVAAVVIYLLQRQLDGQHAARQAGLRAVQAHMDTIAQRKAHAASDTDDEARAKEALAELKKTAAMLHGGVWYATKQVIYGTAVGGVMNVYRGAKRAWGEWQSSRQRSPRPPAQSSVGRR